MFSTLSERELQVLMAYAEGYKRHEIADELDLHDSTIRMHTARLKIKLRARTTAQAIATAYHEGILIPRIRNGNLS
jgi:DNA-binding NarL/FixJ family response regulator